MKKIIFIFLISLPLFHFHNAIGQTILSEGFEDITQLPSMGWLDTNMSVPPGTTVVFQGNDVVFPAYLGTPTSYIGMNYNSTAGTGTISTWLITPQVTVKDGDFISFWTRTTTGSTYPDRLQLRLNIMGTTDVGTDALSTGDFTTVLFDINPGLSVPGYPEEWTEYSTYLTGIPTPTLCRFGFRYFVTNGGPSGSNSNYIGIDEFRIDDGTNILEYENMNFNVFPNPAHTNETINISSPVSGEFHLKIFNYLGQIMYSQNIFLMPYREFSIEIELNTGIYIVQLFDSNNNISGTKQLIIK
jgi:hypothetical protein